MIVVSEDQLKQLWQIAKESEDLETLTELEVQYNKAVNWVYGIYVGYLSDRTYLGIERSYHAKNLATDLKKENRDLSEALDGFKYDYGKKRSRIYSKLSLQVLNELETTFKSIGHRKFVPSEEDIESIEKSKMSKQGSVGC